MLAFNLAGTETDHTAPYGGLKANWWNAGFERIVKQASDFPNIVFGTAAVPYTWNNARGKLLGGNSDSDFQFLPLRGIYASAHMQVTVTRK